MSSCNTRCEGVVVSGDLYSPLLHLRLASPNPSRIEDERQLNEIAKYCTEQGVAVVTAKYLADEMSIPPSR